MKVEAKKVSKTFESVTLTITFESRDEMLDMYARMSLSNREMIPHIRGYKSAVAKIVGADALERAVNSSPDAIEDIPLLVALKKEILG